MKWNKETTERAIELAKKGNTRRQTAELLSLEFNTTFTAQSVRHHLNRLGYSFDRTGVIKDKHAKRDVHIDSDGSQTATVLMRLRHEPNKSPETLMQLCGYDPSQFEMITGDYKVYEQHSVKDGTVPQYSIHVKVRPKSSIDVHELVMILNKGVKPITFKQAKTGSHNLVIPLFDLHFGITTYVGLQSLLNQLVDVIQHGYHDIAIEIGGDLLHSDFMGKTQTVRGTQLDHADTVQAWTDAKRFIDIIIRTAAVNADNVSVWAVGGNHDYDMQWAFVDGLADRYPQITVHNTIGYRQAFQLGHVGILMAHGDVALKSLPMLFANEHSDIWAACQWREIHYGHFHHEIVNDASGVILRQMGTPKPADGYEAKNGYTMAHKTMQAFEYDDRQLRVTYSIGGNDDGR